MSEVGRIQKAIEAGEAFLENFNSSDWTDPHPPNHTETSAKSDKRRQPKPLVAKINGKTEIFTPSEDAFARIFAEQYKGKLLFDHVRGKWLLWDGSRWKQEETMLAFEWMRKTVCESQFENQAKWRKASTLKGVETFARSDRTFATTIHDFDLDPMKLGTPGGTVDLETGRLHPATPEDKITKSSAVAPEEGAPEKWLRFLNEATGEDPDMIRFLQQLCGYSLTGKTSEHKLVFIFGSGANGKSTFIDTVSWLFADYAQTADMVTFTESKYDRHPTELAALKGARLVTASETESGRYWAESRIKSLTGGDRIRARFMRRDEFEFRPEFQLLIVGNHQPRLRAVDDAMKRRLIMINFAHKPKQIIKDLSKILIREEGSKILQWMIQGCCDWQENGLIIPKSARLSTADYFAEQDLISEWLDESCEVRAGFKESATALFRSWSSFCKSANEDPGSQTSFGRDLENRGFTKRKSNGQIIRLGIRLIPQSIENDPRYPGEWD